MQPTFAESIEMDWPDAQEAEASTALVPCEGSSLCQTVAAKLLHKDAEFKKFAHAKPTRDGLADFLFANSDEAHDPAKLFKRLRWGGLCLFADKRHKKILELSDQFSKHGFAIDRPPTYIRNGRWPIPFLNPKIHAFVARKVDLIPPGEITQRFTYQVQLAKHTDPNEPIVVQKDIPSPESVEYRLSKKHPDYRAAGLKKLARKFTDKIFPTFLTREAGFLLILQDHLSAPYDKRVPKLISMEKDERGFVRRLRMNWLRNGGEPITHMEFARQSADLLRALHDIPKVIHLDLRLDNFVITPNGVGFVDFGSAVREDEDLSKNPLLQSLFGELMRTSQIQKLMEQMTLSGRVTSNVIKSACNKPDKAADFFYLALQFNSPHNNPDLAGLIDYDPASKDAQQLSQLTSEILRPTNPEAPKFRSAKDILHGIERIQLGLKRK
jgi:serine/threonine protein kinase